MTAAWMTVLVTLCGGVLARALLGGDGRRAPWLASLAWAPALGFGALSVIFFGWRLVGPSGAGRGSMVVLILASVVAVFLARRRPHALPEAEGSATSGPSSSWIVRLLLWPARLGLIVTVVGLLLAFHRWTERWPLGTADAVNIWNVRARFLLFSEESLPELFAAFQKGHPDYPLMLPASIAAQAGFWGGWDQAIPQATGAAFLIGLGLMIHTGLRRLGVAAFASAGTALVLAAPVIWRWAFSQCADLPVAYLALAAGVALASQLGSGASPPLPAALAGWALGMLVWTKHEGVLLAASLAAAFSILGLIRWRRSAPDTRRLLTLGVAALPGLAALVTFKICCAPPGAVGLFLGESALTRLTDGERWQELFGAVGSTLVAQTSWWLGLATFLVIAVIARPRLRPGGGLQGWFLLTAVMLTATGDLLAYALSPYEIGWHVERSLDRLLLQLLPLTVVGALSLGRSPPASISDSR